MKKVLLFLAIYIGFIIPVFADDSVVNVNFILKEEFYSSVLKTYDGDTTMFDVTFNIDDMRLTSDQIRSILNQNSGVGSSPLAIYQTLQIDVTPNAGTNFSSLVGKSTYYRGNTAGKWVSDYKTSSINNEDDVAVVKPMTSYFWPWGISIQYKTNVDDEFTSSVPSGVNLSGKTMEQKIATLLSIDLDNNPNGVIDEYGVLWNFKMLPSGYTYLNRFDFYDEKDASPVLKDGSLDEYLSSSLNLLDSKNVVIRYHKLSSTMSEDDEVININEESKAGMIIAVIGLVTISIILFIYKKKQIKL